jgi:hypothetical protein
MLVKIKLHPEDNGKWGASLVCGKTKVEVSGMKTRKSAIGQVQKLANRA